MTAAMPPWTALHPVRPESPDDPVTDLGMRMAGLCAGAVDTLEVAAGLEAEGINDESARGYGHDDVFALAQDLFDRIPRRPAPPEVVTDAWRGQIWRQLLRGVLFGLPGVCYATAAPLLTRPAAGMVLVLSLLLSWTASQLLAYLGYVRLGRGDAGSAGRVMRRGLVLAVSTVGPLTVAAGLLIGSGVPATGLAAGQCVYLLTATVALVSGAEPLLLLALLPGVCAGATWAAAGGPVPPWVWIAWGVTVLATTVLAARCSAGTWAGDGAPRAELTAALPYAGFGLVAGGLLTVGEMCVLLGRAAPSPATTAGVLSLSLSMGGAEWLLYTYRSRAHRLLGRSADLRVFVLGSRCLLAGVVALYLAGLGALVAGAAWAAGLTVSTGSVSTGPVSTGSVSTGSVFTGYLGLGGAFFVALLLQSCGHVRSVLAVCALALAAETAVLSADLRPDPEAVQAVAACGLFAVLLAYAFVALSKATCHR
jgi:hypothetical protein